MSQRVVTDIRTAYEDGDVMPLTIVSRSAAGLPPVPSSIGHRSVSSWSGIKVHHTGGPFSSWRAIHDWQTEGRPDDEELAYIGYSFGIADGRVTELRGFDRHPAHDHENSTLGVVFGGSYASALPPAEDLAAFVEFCRLAAERTGRELPITGHRDTWPRGDRRYSTCPGDRLHAHLPELRTRVEEDEVSTQDLRNWETARVPDGEQRPVARLIAWSNEYARRAWLIARANEAKLDLALSGVSDLTVEQIQTATAAAIREVLREGVDEEEDQVLEGPT